MPTNWADYGYEEIETSDGSPSLKSLAFAEAEVMHHRGGAFTESREIYGRLIRPCFESEGPRFLSLGLGLGYNEMLIAEEAVRRGSENWSCVSYEADPVLVEQLLAFLKGESMSSALASTYRKILQGMGEPEPVRASLLKALGENRWILQGPMSSTTVPPFSIHGFLWDAFSQKTSPELWEESFLTEFLGKYSAIDHAGLSTYACIGKLKRALKANGFTVTVCEGFAGKRNSTFAWRAR
jgi:hypothetical protein